VETAVEKNEDSEGGAHHDLSENGREKARQKLAEMLAVMVVREHRRRLAEKRQESDAPERNPQ
jgi:hypothetical protein